VVLSQKALDNIAVEYTQITNKGQAPQLEKYKLYIDKNTSLYEQIFENKEDETIQESDGTTSTVVYPKKEMMKYCFTDIQNKKVIFKDVIATRTVVVNDDYNNFGWKIENVFKKIGNYHCQKATTKFRGRSYTAWFTTKMPFSFGPWKFNGLPGLILDIYDTDKVFHATVSKISFKNQINLKNRIVTIDNSKKIDLNTYIKQKKNQNAEMINLLNSKLPKGAKKFSVCEDCGSLKDLEIFEAK
jgi:GLPGLI family protein